MSSFERSRSLHETAADLLRAAIISGKFPMGQPLSETSLAAQFGISKTPVREALRELSLDGLVKVMPQSGTYVFTMTRSDVIDMSYLREALELSALQLCLQRAPGELGAKLDRIVKEMEQAETMRDRPLYLRLDGDFHGALFQIAGNAYLTQAYEPIADRIAALRTRLSVHGVKMGECLVEHAEIARLARNGAGEDVVAMLRAHIQRVREQYADQIDGTVYSETALIARPRRNRRSVVPTA